MPREISWSSVVASTSPAAICDSSECRSVKIARSVGFDSTYRQPESNESLLRAVVEVALDAATGLASDAVTIRRTEHGELGCALGVHDRGRDELGELLEALFGLRWQAVVAQQPRGSPRAGFRRRLGA